MPALYEKLEAATVVRNDPIFKKISFSADA